MECVRSLVDRGILVRRADGRLERHGDVELTIPAADGAYTVYVSYSQYADRAPDAVLLDRLRSGG